jgi:hypothetical protein
VLERIAVRVARASTRGVEHFRRFALISIILDCGEEAAMAFAHEVLADLEKH